MSVSVQIVIFYLLLVSLIGPIGWWWGRGKGKEDFLLASRSIGPVLLLLSLFGTHMSAFALVGSTAEGYRAGITAFGQLASSSALIAPLVFFFIGTRIWNIGQRHGFVTQTEYFRTRFESDLVGLLMFIMLVLLVIPYVLIGVIGGGRLLNGVFGWSYMFSSALVVIVPTVYVSIGGMRGTTFANAVQTAAFMIIGLISFVAIVNHLGGTQNGFWTNLQSLAAQTQQRVPDRLVREGHVSQLYFLSYMLIPMSVAMFPHVNMHWLTAKKASTFKTAVIFYPLCIMCVWVPTVLLGTLAAGDPSLNLQGPAINAVLAILIKKTGSEILIGLLTAGVLAAVMSSLDSQSLALGEMFTRDVVVHYGGADRWSEGVQVTLARSFVVGVMLITWGIAQLQPGLVFQLGNWCFAGFSALVPILLAGLFWPRGNKWGAFLAIAVVLGLMISMFVFDGAYIPGKGVNPKYRPFGWDVHPVAVLWPASALAMWLGSLMTPKPSDSVRAKFFSSAD